MKKYFSFLIISILITSCDSYNSKEKSATKLAYALASKIKAASGNAFKAQNLTTKNFTEYGIKGTNLIEALKAAQQSVINTKIQKTEIQTAVNNAVKSQVIITPLTSNHFFKTKQKPRTASITSVAFTALFNNRLKPSIYTNPNTHTVAYLIQNKLSTNINLNLLNTTKDTTCKKSLKPKQKCIVAYTANFYTKKTNTLDNYAVNTPLKQRFFIADASGIAIKTQITNKEIDATPWNTTSDIQLIPLNAISAKTVNSRGYISYDFKVTNKTENLLTISKGNLQLKNDLPTTVFKDAPFVSENSCTNIATTNSCKIKFLLPIPLTTNLKTFLKDKPYYRATQRLLLTYGTGTTQKKYLSDDVGFIFRESISKYILQKIGNTIQPLKCIEKPNTPLICTNTGGKLTITAPNNYFNIAVNMNSQKAYIVTDTNIERCKIQFNGELGSCKTQNFTSTDILQFKDITWDFENQKLYAIKNINNVDKIKICSVNSNTINIFDNNCSEQNVTLKDYTLKQVVLSKNRNTAYIIGQQTKNNNTTSAVYYCTINDTTLTKNLLKNCSKMTLINNALDLNWHYKDTTKQNDTEHIVYPDIAADFNKATLAYDQNQLVLTSKLNSKYYLCNFDLTDENKLICKKSTKTLDTQIAHTASITNFTLNNIKIDTEKQQGYVFVNSNSTPKYSQIFKCKFLQDDAQFTDCSLYFDGQHKSETFSGLQYNTTVDSGGLLVTSVKGENGYKIPAYISSTQITVQMAFIIKNITNKPITLTKSTVEVISSFFNEQPNKSAIDPTNTGCFVTTTKNLLPDKFCTLTYDVDINPRTINKAKQMFSFNYLQVTDASNAKYILPLQATLIPEKADILIARVNNAIGNNKAGNLQSEDFITYDIKGTDIPEGLAAARAAASTTATSLTKSKKQNAIQTAINTKINSLIEITPQTSATLYDMAQKPTTHTIAYKIINKLSQAITHKINKDLIQNNIQLKFSKNHDASTCKDTIAPTTLAKKSCIVAYDIKLNPKVAITANNSTQDFNLGYVSDIPITTKITLVVNNATPWNKNTPDIALIQKNTFSALNLNSEGYIAYDFKVINKASTELTIPDGKLELKSNLPAVFTEAPFLSENSCKKIASNDTCQIHYLLHIPKTQAFTTFKNKKPYYGIAQQLKFINNGTTYLSDDVGFVLRPSTSKYLLQKNNSNIQPLICSGSFSLNIHPASTNSKITCKKTGTTLAINTNNKYFNMDIHINAQKAYIVTDTDIERCKILFNGQLGNCQTTALPGAINKFKDIALDFENQNLYAITRTNKIAMCAINNDDTPDIIDANCVIQSKAPTLLITESFNQILLSKNKQSIYIVQKAKPKEAILYSCPINYTNPLDANSLQSCTKMTIDHNDNKATNKFNFTKIAFSLDKNQLLLTDGLNKEYSVCDFSLPEANRLFCAKKSFPTAANNSTPKKLPFGTGYSLGDIIIDSLNHDKEYIFINNTTNQTTQIYHCDYTPKEGIGDCDNVPVKHSIATTTGNSYYALHEISTVSPGVFSITPKDIDASAKTETSTTNNATLPVKFTIKNKSNQAETITSFTVMDSIFNNKTTITPAATTCTKSGSNITVAGKGECELSYQITLPKQGSASQKLSLNYLKIVNSELGKYPYFPMQALLVKRTITK